MYETWWKLSNNHRRLLFWMFDLFNLWSDLVQMGNHTDSSSASHAAQSVACCYESEVKIAIQCLMWFSVLESHRQAYTPTKKTQYSEVFVFTLITRANHWDFYWIFPFFEKFNQDHFGEKRSIRWVNILFLLFNILFDSEPSLNIFRKKF